MSRACADRAEAHQFTHIKQKAATTPTGTEGRLIELLNFLMSPLQEGISRTGYQLQSFVYRAATSAASALFSASGISNDHFFELLTPVAARFYKALLKSLSSGP